ncbi:CPXCG motif-containing cysteine-rich protein [Lysobacter fragariae]
MLPTITVHCPYCGEPVELMIDAADDLQRYVEDCPVCCRPIEVSVAIDGAGELLVSAMRDNEA